MREFGSDFDDKDSNFNMRLDELRKRFKIAMLDHTTQEGIKALAASMVACRLEGNPFLFHINSGESKYNLKVPTENEKYFISQFDERFDDMFDHYVEAFIKLGLSQGKMNNVAYVATILPLLNKAFREETDLELREEKRTLLLHNINRLMDLDSHVFKAYNKDLGRFSCFIAMQAGLKITPLWQIVPPCSYWEFTSKDSTQILPNICYIDESEAELLTKKTNEFVFSFDTELIWRYLSSSLKKSDVTIKGNGVMNFSIENIQPQNCICDKKDRSMER